MIFEENITRKKDNKTITNNITRNKITITEDENTTTLPYAILAITEQKIVIQKGQDITSIPKIMIPQELGEIITILEQPEPKQTSKKEETPKKKTNTKKEKDEKNDKKTK